MHNSEIQFISTDTAAKPQGHYSQAVSYAGTIFVAMQIAIDPTEGPLNASATDQAKLALQNVSKILEAAGSSLQRALRITVYLSEIALWEEVNKVYSDVLGDHRPARSVVPTGKLHLGLDVGFEVIAAA
jgi:2-iminobutanoate/2-iminopropanoate deaminase